MTTVANEVWLGIDLGTSSCKVVATDVHGAVRAVRTGDYPWQTPNPGWAEQDPHEWWDVTDRCVSSLVAALPPGTRVRGIGLSGQMHGLCALDGDDQLIRPAILWNDQRCAAECDEIIDTVGGLDALLALTDNNMLPGFTAGKIIWLRNHEPDHFRRMRSFLNPKDYLRLRMTGRHQTDVSDASGTGLLDVRRRRWSTELMTALDLPESLLPALLESSEVGGHLLDEVAQRWGLPAETPVVGGGGDSVLQTTATGMTAPGVLGVTIGTAGIVAAAAEVCPDNPGGRLQVSCGNAPGVWHVMGVALSAGGAFHWLRDTLATLAPELTFDAMVDLAENAEPGSGGLLFLPYLQGERCPWVAPEARGAWVGLTSATGTEELVRSVVEGVLLNLRQIRDVFAAAGLAVDRVRANGGATAGHIWLQLLADILGSDVASLSAGEHGGAVGAALLAAVGTGHWATLDEALAGLETTGIVTPRAERVSVYDALYPQFHAAYAGLAPLFAASSPGGHRD